MVAQAGLTFSWEPFAVIAVFGVSYLASLACGIVALVMIASRNPRLELPAVCVSGGGLLLMGAWLAVLLNRMPALLALNLAATVIGAVPVVLCAIALRFAIVRRRAARRGRLRPTTESARAFHASGFPPPLPGGGTESMAFGRHRPA